MDCANCGFPIEAIYEEWHDLGGDRGDIHVGWDHVGPVRKNDRCPGAEPFVRDLPASRKPEDVEVWLTR